MSAATNESPWRKALKPAGAAFGWGSFLGIAAAYRNAMDFTGLGRPISAGIMGVVLGLIFAAVSYPVAIVVYVIRGSK